MKQASSIGKSILSLCKAYWRWANQVADNHKIPEAKLNKMVQKGKFKNREDAERATKRSTKSVLIASPFIFLLILASVLHNSKDQSVVIQSPKGAVSTQPEQLDQNSPTASRDFKTFLPSEDEELKSFILADSWLNGFLGDVWIGYATKTDLLNRGFYINTLYKYTGQGEGLAAEAKGACSPIGFDGAFICRRGTMQPSQWGIQSDEAISRLNVLEEEWSKR